MQNKNAKVTRRERELVVCEFLLYRVSVEIDRVYIERIIVCCGQRNLSLKEHCSVGS